jgi:hypothetical protein
MVARRDRVRVRTPKTAAGKAARDRLKGTMIVNGAEVSKTAKFAAHARTAMQVAMRLVEHYPVTGNAPPRPRTPAQLIEYVEWALPRARKLGTRVSPAEARSVGFMHAAHRLKTAAAEDALAKQRDEAARDLLAKAQAGDVSAAESIGDVVLTLEGLSKTESDRAVAEPDQALEPV